MLEAEDKRKRGDWMGSGRRLEDLLHGLGGGELKGGEEQITIAVGNIL